jgi:hypothetical protein
MVEADRVNGRPSAITVTLAALNLILYGFQGIRTLLEGQTMLALSNFLFLAGFLAAILMIWKGWYGNVLALILLVLVGYRMSGAVLDFSRDLLFRAAHGAMIGLAALFTLAAFRDHYGSRDSGTAGSRSRHAGA